ncbi:LysE family translocator [bacterium]|nr:LysE family translocator [bacterium]
MENYPVFLLVAATAVFNPGPGVTLTLTNSLRYGLRHTLGGIAGIAFGGLIMAIVSATGLGLLMATSQHALSVLKLTGSAYLIFLGIKMWRKSPDANDENEVLRTGIQKRFAEAFWLQLSNPNAILFFISAFPQFIDPASPYIFQFSILSFTYCLMVLIIHTIYALTARTAKKWLSSPIASHRINQAGGIVLIVFGLILAFQSQV